ncbi:basic-leucine zipper transcription factor A isoform X2 [Drosophila willistoni]|uniref:basic-leucine zipper transcription factor A isoform X2 n=1 Tax=Drosophila willistoni TaxID=7260 RepID=UPI00017D78A4|nr:basic-leucine zipper transcription factor A isoform X2 [Drosophila willistoni]
MNNFTTTTAAAPPPGTKESLPRSGHVNEVCKEWLVREDGALAYKLQSQEINDFYKGNRYRNAVVREDFPTALHEQIKEKEQAQRQVDDYRRRLTEQEEHDKRVAKEIADKLERDLQEQQQRELDQSELIAKQMQEIYVNLPPVPPPATRDTTRPPPRPAKASIHHQQHPQQQQQQHLTNGHHEPSTSQQSRYQHEQQQQHQPLQLQQKHFSQTDNYVGLSLIPNIVDMPATPTAAAAVAAAVTTTTAAAAAAATTATATSTPSRHTQSTHSQLLVSDATSSHQHQQQQQQQQQQQHTRFHHAHQQHQSSSSRRYVYEPFNIPSTAPTSQHTPTHSIQGSTIDEVVDYADVADSIRDYNISSTTATPNATAAASATVVDAAALTKQRSPSHENLLRTEPKFQKLSPEKYDQLVGNFGIPTGTGAANGSSSNSKAVERHMQQHADDIELYVDPCDYASLREIGLPMDEIKEMSKKLKQEQKDELLARRLQAIESKDCVRQEHRDRMLAIEAQDKELAKMLQDREKAKAKRAKEKARLRKSQQKEAAAAANGGVNSNGLLCGTSSHCGPLLALPQDCMAMSQSTHSQADIDVEAYSNPIDVLNSSREQRQPNGTLTNGSLTRDGGSNHSSMQRQQRLAQATSLSRGEDDIYTLPVDSCRPGQQRPVSLHMAAETVQQMQTHNSMTRSEHYGSEAGSHDSSIHNGHDISPHMKYSKSGNFDQSASPTPPYMPIQGTRRSNSSEDRKKKSKDNKCTHQ